MAPASAVDKIKHLLISTTDHGIEFDKYLTEKEILRPVVLIADGHSSQFEYEILLFLLENKYGFSLAQLSAQVSLNCSASSTKICITNTESARITCSMLFNP